jgi:hypothetical protein
MCHFCQEYATSCPLPSFNPRTILFSPERKVSMSQLRNEVQDLIRVSMHLLSPDSLGDPLTADECSVVEFYALSLLEEYRAPAEH